MEATPRFQTQRGARVFLPAIALAIFAAASPKASASFIGIYDPGHFTLVNSNADGSADISLAPNSVALIGGNNGSGFSGTTTLSAISPYSGLVTFHYLYSSLDLPSLDDAGYLANGAFTMLASSNGMSGNVTFAVTPGQTFGFRVDTVDNQGEPGVLTISNFSAPVPEPGTGALLSIVVGLVLGGAFVRSRARRVAGIAVTLVSFAASAFAQGLGYRSVNGNSAVLTGSIDVKKAATLPVSPNLAASGGTAKMRSLSARRLPRVAAIAKPFAAAALIPGTPVGTGGAFGFRGITERDQAQANLFSIEPPDQGLAVGNGYVVEAVNNAFQVYSSTGAPLLPQPLATTQLFGLPAVFNPTTGVFGVFLSDPRVYFDQDSGRFFVVQWTQLNDAAGNPLDQSREYIAVSQTGNAAGTYNIYTIDTTLASTAGCPCIPDYPQVGADAYGFYISSNEFTTSATATDPYVAASIRAISKAGLIAGAANPTSSLLLVPYTTGYEFTIHPASTPPGASYFLANGGLEYFVSSYSAADSGSALAVWALTNTSSLNSSSPQLTLLQSIVSTQSYTIPNAATQKSGPLPYGSSLTPPGLLPQIDGGDYRILSAVYSGGRLYATVASQLTDGTGTSVVGAEYFILTPTYRAGSLGAQVLRQGSVTVNGNHLLRPAITVNAQGRGAIVFTLVGPGYFPSAAYLPITTSTTGNLIQVVAAGAAPEDGFTGYPSNGSQGVARWGDYSAAVVDTDGSIWMGTEYIPGGLRSTFANWGTFLFHIVP